MTDSEREEYDKLGTVLAITNQITKDTLDMLKDSLVMLKKQQERQVRMIWSSVGIVAMAIAVLGMTVYMTFGSLEKLSPPATNGEKMMTNEYQQEISEGASK